MVITLQEMRSKKEVRKRVLEETLEKVIKQLAEMGALKIVLFGSFASGSVRSWSDLDIIAVMPSSRTGREWMKKVYEEVDREVECDIIACTEDELKRTIPVSRFLRHALKTGKIIYEAGS